ncbi:glycosyltransferase family 2 protein [uncultured Candidatus Kuenenia sp.]|uniref:glycosyltransferase family A protein n=1 Tax=uncultured Candidatus Kuenenia sp. TaxID=1048336 RepID=UPI0002DAB5D2|nr:glycosyltransferase family 2 protein [uncultured Candidatus Kuenenia sp.]
MNYSIIVATCNRQNDLAKLIDSILMQTVLPLEVIIVDQSDTGDTKKYIEDCRKQFLTKSNKIEVIYIYQAEKSLVAARNKGINIAIGEIVSFLDDDVVLFEDYYEQVLRYFNNDEKLGGVGGNVMIERELQGWKWKLRRAMLKIFLLNNYDGKMTVSGFGYPIIGIAIDRPVQVEMLLGCNMNFRSEYLKNDKFDEWFIGYSFREDAELSYRISREAVLKMIPEAKLYHNCSKSNRMNIRPKKVMEVKNFYYVYKKHAKKTMISNIVFFYSLSGLWIIYGIEFLCNGNKEKCKQLQGFTEGIISLLKTNNNP